MKHRAIEKTEYESLTSMLNSKDEADQKLALTTIENIGFKENLTKILLLKKKTNVGLELWKAHAPKTISKLKKIKVEAGDYLTYKEILKLIVDKTSAEEIQFFLDDFAEHLLVSIKDIGFDFIEDAKIEIKLKQNDKTGITS